MYHRAKQKHENLQYIFSKTRCTSFRYLTSAVHYYSTYPVTSSQSYLDVLRNPELSETFKAAYIPQISPSDSTTTAVDSDSESASGSTAHEDEAIPSAFPMVQPMKAALYFDSADGFGDWRILISTRADRNLREAKRRDQNLFRIIIKKIK